MNEGSVLYQVSLLQALSLGRYEGSVKISELKKNGNIGIGTFDGLDGEINSPFNGVIEKSITESERIIFQFQSCLLSNLLS